VRHRAHAGCRSPARGGSERPRALGVVARAAGAGAPGRTPGRRRWRGRGARMTGRKRGVPRAAAFAVLGGSVLGVAATGSTATADMIDGGTPGVLTIEVMPGTIELILDPGEHGSWLLTPRLDSG